MINIKVRNLDQVKKAISDLPRGARGAATEAAALALIGNERTGLQHYPARKQHDASNPYVWQTAKQRRAFFATNGFGAGIPSKRTDNLRFGWKAQSWGDKTKIKVINDQEYARFVMGDAMQRGHKADGWRTYQEVISTNINAMMRAVNQAVARYIKNKRL